MEKEVNALLEESATASTQNKKDMALDRAQKAATKERKLGIRGLSPHILHHALDLASFSFASIPGPRIRA
jgi:hypothetical protein